MTYTAEQIINGIINYADNEIMMKLPTPGKWVMGTAIGLASNKAGNVYEMLKDMPVVKMLGLIDEDGRIDVDDLIRALHESADKYGNMTVEIPLVGKLTFSSSDIDSLQGYIR